jgi:hypothetical protein
MSVVSKSCLSVGRSSKARWSGIGACIVSLTMLLLGAGKAADLSAFRDGLLGWTVLSPNVRSVVVVIVPAAEIAFGVLYIAGVLWRLLRWGALAILSIVTSAFLVQLSTGEIPNCSCLGLWARYFEVAGSWPEKMLLNGGLALALAASWSGHAGMDQGQELRAGDV